MSTLSVGDSQQLLNVGSAFERQAGEKVISESDVGPLWTGVILYGRCRVLSLREDGTEAYLAARGKGDLIGEMAAVRGTTRSATVFALTDVRVHMIPEARFRYILDSQHVITRRLLTYQSHHLHEADRNGADLASVTTKRRVTRLLLRLAQSEGVVGTDGTTTIDAVRHTDLAQWAGVSVKSVQRRIGSLVDCGVVERREEKCQVLIRDMARLAEIAARGDDDE